MSELATQALIVGESLVSDGVHETPRGPTALHVRYEARLGDFLSAYSHCYWQNFWRGRRLATVVVVEACIALAIDEWTEIGSVAFVIGLTAFSILMSLALTVCSGRLAAWRSYRHHSKIPGDVAVEVDARALITTTASSQTRISWSGLTGWSETKRVVLLYRSDELYQFIPKRALDGDGSDALRTFARDAGLSPPSRRRRARGAEGVTDVPMAA